MNAFDYTVTTGKPVEEAAAAVEANTAAAGFRVLHTHDVTATLAEKGFQREPMKIVEICSAKYANEALKNDPKVSLMLPCPISVYAQNGQTYISTLLPSTLVEFYPEAGIEDVAREVERVVRSIVDASR